MNPTSLRGTLEATRLTRAGRLSEATALLQHLLCDRAPRDDSNPPGRPTPVTIDGVAEIIDIADFVPRAGTSARASDTSGGRPQADSGGAAAPPVSALRGLLRLGSRV